MPQIIINLHCKNNKKRCNCRNHAKKKRCRRRRKYKISIRPIVRRYFFVTPNEINLEAEKVILANQFIDDRGESINKFSNFGKEGYLNLYINGVLQEGKIYHVHSDAVKLIATGQNILIGSPIILESVGFTTKLVYK